MNKKSAISLLVATNNEFVILFRIDNLVKKTLLNSKIRHEFHAFVTEHNTEIGVAIFEETTP